MEELPCKRRRVRWLCTTTTKTHQLRENSPEPPSLCTACEAFRARALPAAQRPPFSTTESQWFPSLRQTLWIQAIPWHCCRSSPREASGQLRLGAPFHQFPSQPSSCGSPIPRFLIQLSGWALALWTRLGLTVYFQGLIQHLANRRCSKKSVCGMNDWSTIQMKSLWRIKNNENRKVRWVKFFTGFILFAMNPIHI